jgi:hypothetical protein
MSEQIYALRLIARQLADSRYNECEGTFTGFFAFLAEQSTGRRRRQQEQSSSGERIPGNGSAGSGSSSILHPESSASAVFDVFETDSPLGTSPIASTPQGSTASPPLQTSGSSAESASWMLVLQILISSFLLFPR